LLTIKYVYLINAGAIIAIATIEIALLIAVPVEAAQGALASAPSAPDQPQRRRVIVINKTVSLLAKSNCLLLVVANYQ
jgi:hypothetical protein